MRKEISLLVITLALLCSPLSSVAQDSNSQPTLEEMTESMCDCVNLLMADMHPEVQKVILQMDTENKAHAEQDFKKYVGEHPEEMERIMNDTKKLETFGTSIEKIEGCEEMSTIISGAYINDNPGSVEEMEGYFRDKEKCRFAYIFYQAGKQGGQEGAPEKDH